MSEFGQGIGDDETVVPFSVSVLNLLQEISEKLDRPMIQVTNNPVPETSVVSIPSKPITIDPNFEMLSAICLEIHEQLTKVMDNPDLDTFKKAQEFRRIAATFRAKGLKFKSQAEEIKAKLERKK